MFETKKIKVIGLLPAMVMVLGLLMALIVPMAQAQWSQAPVSGSGHNSVTVAVMDNDGAKFLVWADGSGATSQIMAQKLDSNGRELWGEGGIAVHPTSSSFRQVEPTAASDGNGGLVVCWTDERTDTHSVFLYSMRLDASGQEMWPAGLRGTLVCNASGDHRNATMVGDGKGGFYVAFEDTRNGNPGVYAQYLNGDGDRLWADLGVKIRESGSDCTSIGITTSPAGGAAFVWREAREFAPFYAWVQAVDDAGNVLWADGGVRALGSSRDHYLPRISDCGQGSLMVASYSKAGNAHFTEVTRLDVANGESLWGNYMVHEHIFVSSIRGFELAPASDGGAYLVIGVDPSISLMDDYAEIRRCGSHPQWLGTISFSTSYLDKLAAREINPGILAVAFSDPSNETISCWGYDFTIPDSPVSLWFEEEFGVCEWTEPISIAAVHDRGAMFSWINEGDMYASFIDHQGHLNHGFPQIKTLVDVPDDQGGWLTITWEASTLETAYFPSISQYSLWMRSAGFDQAKSLDPAPLEVEKTAAESGVTWDQAAKMLSTGWSYISVVPAFQQETYSALVPSPANQSESGTPRTEYMVMAHDLQAGHFYRSEYAFGVSLDNVAPGAPANLAGEFGEGNVGLQWSAVADVANDLGGYRIYGSPVAAFTPSPSNFLGVTTTTEYTDETVSDPRYYVVTAKDVHGNEGAPSAEIEVASGALPAGQVASVFQVSGAHPNPFNPSTTFDFVLPSVSWVDVDILDLRGNRVNRLASETLSAGFHEMRWNGRDETGRLVNSGVYFARVRSLFGNQTVKMTLAK